jgi:hypothetical protein
MRTSLTWLVSIVALAASCHGTDTSGGTEREGSDGASSGGFLGDGSTEGDSGASDIQCGISGDGGTASPCECVGASPPLTLPNVRAVQPS